MRSVVYHFPDPAALGAALSGAQNELELPGPEVVSDGEWVLAIFEVGAGRRATASAARGVIRAGHPYLIFEERDWERIRGFGKPKPAGAAAGPDDEPRTERAVESEAMALPLVTPAARDESPESMPDSLEGPSSLMSPDTLRPAPNLPGGGAAHGARVLVVDDDPDMCMMVSTMLEAVGLTAHSALSGEQAFSMLQSGGFDLVIVDWTLPGMNGVELCRRVRRNTNTATMPVLFLSARTASAEIVDAFASGADDFVTKPFRAPELGARIFALLRRARISATNPPPRP